MKTKKQTKVKETPKETSKKITKDMKISEVLDGNPDAAEVLYEIGFGCIGCPMSIHETIEQGASVHGMSEKEINEIVKELNRRKGK